MTDEVPDKGTPTPSQAARTALSARTRLINDNAAEVAAILQQASDEITAMLTKQPSDYQRWYLPQLQAQVKEALRRRGAEAGQAAAQGQAAAWRGGVGLTDAVLSASTISAVLPVIDDGQLRAMSAFLTEKIAGITVEAANAINTQLGLVTLGAQTPFDAVKAVQALLTSTTARRARTIVHTELARAYSTANQLRMEQAVIDVPGLRKRWVKSGKVHPRPHHVLANGQLRDIDQPFNLPNGVTMMYPHHPAAPAGETINCGCVAVPVVPGKKRTLPADDGDDAGVPLSKVMKRADTLDAPAVRRKLREVRRELGSLEFEHAVFIDGAGNEVLRKTGGATRIRFTQAETAKLAGTIGTHNHPGVGSFSESDIAFAMAHDLKEQHVVDDVYHYVMRPGSGGWSRALWEGRVRQVVAQELAGLTSQWQAALAAGQISRDAYNEHLYDELWRRVALATGLNYKRRVRSRNEY